MTRQVGGSCGERSRLRVSDLPIIAPLLFIFSHPRPVRGSKERGHGGPQSRDSMCYLKCCRAPGSRGTMLLDIFAPRFLVVIRQVRQRWSLKKHSSAGGELKQTASQNATLRKSHSDSHRHWDLKRKVEETRDRDEKSCIPDCDLGITWID
jgi:hypothetical protein